MKRRPDPSAVRVGRCKQFLSERQAPPHVMPMLVPDLEPRRQQRKAHGHERQDHPCQHVPTEGRVERIVDHEAAHEFGYRPAADHGQWTAERLGIPIQRVDTEQVCDQKDGGGVEQAVVVEEEEPEVCPWSLTPSFA